MNVADLVWEYLRNLTVADFVSRAGPALGRWVREHDDRLRRLQRAQQRLPPDEPRQPCLDQTLVAVLVTDLSPADLGILLEPSLGRIQTFDAAADSPSMVPGDLCVADGPATLLVHNVHALDPWGLHPLLVALQACRPFCRLAVVSPQSAELVCLSQLLGKRCRLVEWVKPVRLLDAEEVFERLVYRAFINNPVLPLRLTASAMQQLQQTWAVSHSVTAVLRFVRVLLARHLVTQPAACLSPLLLPACLAQPLRPAAPSPRPAPPPSAPAPPLAPAPASSSYATGSSGNAKEPPEEGDEEEEEEEPNSPDVLWGPAAEDSGGGPGPRAPSACLSDMSAGRPPVPLPCDAEQATSSNATPLGPAQSATRGLPELDKGWADPRCPVAFTGVAHLLAFLRNEDCSSFTDCDEEDTGEIAQSNNVPSESHLDGDGAAYPLEATEEERTSEYAEAGPVWKVGVPRAVAQCVGQLSAQYLKRIAANVIGLRPKRSDGAACRTAQQTAALEDVKGGLRRRHGYARCLAQQLQDLHLHSFAFAAGFDVLFTIFHTISPRHEMLHGTAASPSGNAASSTCSSSLPSYAHFYHELLRQGTPIAETEVMRQCLELVSRVSQASLLLAVLKGCIHALRGYGDDLDRAGVPGRATHRRSAAPPATTEALPGNPAAPAEGLHLPDLHPLVRRMREVRYGASIAELTQCRARLQNQPNAAGALQAARERLDKFLRGEFPDFELAALPALPLSEAVVLDAAASTGQWWAAAMRGEHEPCPDEGCLAHSHFGLDTFHLAPTRRFPHLEFQHPNLYGVAAPNNATGFGLPPDALLYRLLAEESRGISRPALLDKFINKLPKEASAEERRLFRQQFDDALQTLQFSNMLRVRNHLISLAS